MAAPEIHMAPCINGSLSASFPNSRTFTAVKLMKKVTSPSASSLALPLLSLLLLPLQSRAQVTTPGINLKVKAPLVTPVVKQAKPDVSKMVSVLKGRSDVKPSKPSSSPSGSRPAAIVNPGLIVERTTTIAPQALPKGYQPGSSGAPMAIKKGRTPAEGGPTAPEGTLSSSTNYMKKGNTPAEGSYGPSSPPYSTRVKDGRSAPEGVDPQRFSNSTNGYTGNGYGNSPYPAAPSGQLTYRVDSSSQLSTNTVKFLKGSTELADSASYDYLISLASALQSPELAAHRFVVEGHASAEGSDYANLLLSQRRSNAIFDFLLSRGVSPQRLLAVGHGESHARFADYEPEYLRAQDRQVVVFKLAE